MDPQPLAPHCPRCDYDLSGAVAAWPTDRCPTRGVCSECGLEILWGDLLNPRFTVSDRLFETARRPRTGIFLRSWLLVLLPWRLWRAMELHFRMRPFRLAAFVVIVFALEWVLTALPTSVRNYVQWIWPRGGLRLPRGSYEWSWITLAPLWPHDVTEWGGTIVREVAFGTAWILLSLFMFGMVPQTLRRARVQPGHLVRIWSYSLVGIPILISAIPLAWRFTVSFGAGPRFANWIALGTMAHPERTLICYTAPWGAWILLCWGFAAKHYLRLERPWAVAGTLVLLGGLALGTIAAVVGACSYDSLRWMLRT